MRHLTKIFAIVMVALMMSSCFKDEEQGTLFKIHVVSQESSEAELEDCATELRAYAFYTKKGEEWTVASWDDALNCKATHSERATQVLTEPDVIGTWDADGDYQLALDLRARYTFMVVVDVENQIYAYRNYETPMNWPKTLTELHLYEWSKSNKANGWTVGRASDEQ
jgi:hypothetical protein